MPNKYWNPKNGCCDANECLAAFEGVAVATHRAFLGEEFEQKLIVTINQHAQIKKGEGGLTLRSLPKLCNTLLRISRRWNVKNIPNSLKRCKGCPFGGSSSRPCMSATVQQYRDLLDGKRDQFPYLDESCHGSMTVRLLSLFRENSNAGKLPSPLSVLLEKNGLPSSTVDGPGTMDCTKEAVSETPFDAKRDVEKLENDTKVKKTEKENEEAPKKTRNLKRGAEEPSQDTETKKRIKKNDSFTYGDNEEVIMPYSISKMVDKEKRLLKEVKDLKAEITSKEDIIRQRQEQLSLRAVQTQGQSSNKALTKKLQDLTIEVGVKAEAIRQHATHKQALESRLDKLARDEMSLATTLEAKEIIIRQKETSITELQQSVIDLQYQLLARDQREETSLAKMREPKD